MAVKVCAYIYAALMGFGVSVSVHWASDVFAGMLIGHAIGKTIGKSYRKLIENEAEKQHISFYATGNSFGVVISM
jgi:membrane-associated phospholipid phosphatase